MSVVPGRPPPAAGSVVAAFLLALAAGGCSAGQESLECPGQDCPAELRSVADDTAGLDVVTSVDRTWRFYTLDHGHSGGVEVHASVGTRQQAQALAGRISGVYQHSGVEKVDTISVVVVPDPERAVRDDSATLLGGEASPGAEVPCARDRCGDEIAGFEDAFASDPLARVATLESVRWTSDGRDAETDVEVTSTAGLMAPSDLRSLENRVLDVAQDAGLPDIGDVRVLIHYQRRVDFSFAYHPGK